MKRLTKDQQSVLDFIEGYQAEHGSSPTVREIAAHFGYRSPNSVHQHLRLIEQKGWIRRRAGKARGIELMTSGQRAYGEKMVSVPLVGAIAAGTPVTAVENVECTVSVDREMFKQEGLFSLRVRGSSMTGIGIMDGDIAIIHGRSSVDNGEVAAVLVEEEATLKRVVREKGRVVLHAENPAFYDIVVPPDRDAHILGKLVGVVRKC